MKKALLIIAALVAVNLTQAQWEPDVRLTNDPGSSMTSGFTSGHSIATNGDSIHVVWYDDRDGYSEIYYKRSIDNGLTWEEDVRLTYRDSIAIFPIIAVSGSVVHMVWTEYPDLIGTGVAVYYKRSPDGGNTWGEDTRLTNNSSHKWASCMAVSGSLIHLVYYEKIGVNWWDIFYKRSTDAGLTWEPVVQLTDEPAISAWPSICSIGTVLHVAWYDRRDGNNEIYYKRSTDAGITWGPDTRLTISPMNSAYPCIGASESDVHIVWEDLRDGNSEIYYKQSTDGGDSWGEDLRLTNNSGESYYNNLAVNGSNLFVVWADESDGNWEIYYKHSTDGGLNWEAEMRLTDDLSESNKPFIATSGSQVNVVWNDYREGNYEIYYKRNPTGGFPVGINNELTRNFDQAVNIYPNPASSLLHIDFNSLTDDNLDLRIIDLSGQTIGSYNFASSRGLNQYAIDVKDFCNGRYFIQLTSGKQRHLGKIVIWK